MPFFRSTVLNTICSNTQFMYSWSWAYRCPKHIELFKTINKCVHQVGTPRHLTKRSLLHILRPSCRKFYKRVHWKYVTAGNTFIAAGNQCAFWSPAVSKCPKPTPHLDLFPRLMWPAGLHQSNGNPNSHTYECKWTFILTLHVCCPIWVRLVTRDLRIILLSFYEFRKYRRWEGRTFLWP
jgi:hypothetical protein